MSSFATFQRAVATVSIAVLAVVPAVPGAAQEAHDPLGLAHHAEAERPFTMGEDRIGVFLCEGAARSAQFYALELERIAGPWFAHHSRGRYVPRFLPQDEVLPGDWFTCRSGTNSVETDELQSRHPSLTNAAIIGPDAFAAALQQFLCWDDDADRSVTCPNLLDTPLSHRYFTLHDRSFAFPGELDYDTFFNSHNMVHEMAHTLHWPHTFTDQVESPYDTFGDVMSGGARSLRPDEIPPFAPVSATNVFTLYRAGWIDPGEVEIVSGSGRFELHPNHAPDGRTRMLVIEGDGGFWVMGARPGGPHDVIDEQWEGVEVYWVYLDPVKHWPGNQRAVPLYRIPTRDIPQGDTFVDYEELGRRLPHVLEVGGSAFVGNHTVEVVARAGDRFTVRVTPGTGFVDTAGSVFASDIEWLAATEITTGCNPPHNTRFCPNDPVSRAQMASFLTRALDLGEGEEGRFTDVGGSNPHRRDIAALASARITTGCNPPTNTRFCPGAPVTRAQMASFLARALDLAPGEEGRFTDVSGSNPHGRDIAALAAAGITRGCNPPANTRFCPGAPVTRAQMAAFLLRALGG